MKPATPLRVLGEGRMKPVTPLRAENGLKLALLCEQRCQRFQTCATRNSQWCRWFHLVAVTHPHWCHRFQARRSVGVASRPPRKVARNSIGRSFNKVGKRCNSNDHISEFERDVGELRAKLRVGSAMMWILINTTGPTGVEGAGGPGCGARGWWRGLALVSVGGGENCLKQMSHVI